MHFICPHCDTPFVREDTLDAEETHDPIICKTHQESKAADAAFDEGVHFIFGCLIPWRKGS